MTKLPAKRKHDIIPADRPRQEKRHPFLPIKKLKWFKIRDRDMFGAEGYFVDRYLIGRRPVPNNIYWSAGVNLSTNPVFLGEEFLTRYEAMEVCEAWEYARIRARELRDSIKDNELGDVKENKKLPAP